MASFELFQDRAGEHRFRLKADNGEIILASEGYTTKDGALNGIAAVKKEATNDARYVRRQSPAGFSFYLQARNNEVIGTSEVYSSAKGRDAGIESVKKNAPAAVSILTGLGHVKHLRIRNFKTIQSLDLDCKRFNVFVGDTSAGKSNIIEALTLVSQAVLGDHVDPFDKRVIRYGQLNDLFPGRDVSKVLGVRTGILDVEAKFDPSSGFTFNYKDGWGSESRERFSNGSRGSSNLAEQRSLDTSIRRYEFDPRVKFAAHWFTHLAPPDGSNLVALLMTNEPLANEVEKILASKDLAFELDPETYSISLRHERSKRVVVKLPFGNLSETIKRYLFLYTALRTNSNAILLLDEPEQHTFPFYTKHIAELMAREPSNQYFISTHNQYFLQALLEKAPKGSVQVLGTYRKNDHTAIIPLPQKKVLEMMEYDFFLNLDRLLPGR